AASGPAWRSPIGTRSCVEPTTSSCCRMERSKAKARSTTCSPPAPKCAPCGRKILMKENAMTTESPYSDLDVALLYDVLNPWGPGDAFYFDLVMDAPTVLDVGCGTGAILKRARAEGHTGRLVGLD